MWEVYKLSLEVAYPVFVHVLLAEFNSLMYPTPGEISSSCELESGFGKQPEVQIFSRKLCWGDSLLEWREI